MADFCVHINEHDSSVNQNGGGVRIPTLANDLLPSQERLRSVDLLICLD